MDDSFIDRMLIRELYSSYSDAVFQKDKDAWLNCYSDDGVWILFKKEVRGKVQLSLKWDETWSLIDRMAFFSEIGKMDINEHSANVRSYCHEIVSYKKGNVFKVVAQYTDELTKVDGCWVFSKRDYDLLIKE